MGIRARAFLLEGFLVAAKHRQLAGHGVDHGLQRGQQRRQINQQLLPDRWFRLAEFLDQIFIRAEVCKINEGVLFADSGAGDQLRCGWLALKGPARNHRGIENEGIDDPGALGLQQAVCERGQRKNVGVVRLACGVMLPDSQSLIARKLDRRRNRDA
jgi:hypothetical protein